MQLVIDFLPIFAFFAVYQFMGIYAATTAIIVVMAVQIVVQWLRHRRVNKMLLVSGVLVAVFGGATLWLRNAVFIQWKPTIVNWIFAAAFLGSQFVGKKTLTERAMGQAVELEPNIWRQLNLIWVINFSVLGIANLYVVYNFDEATWVNFKLFGMLGLTLVTAIGQAAWIASKATIREHNEPEN
jgi:intracellular septation protein